MTSKKNQNPEPRIVNPSVAASVGPLLLNLCNALHEVERCRIALKAMGFPHKRWQEIVNDVNPELRFVLRAQTLDAIVAYLKSVGKPVERNRLTRALYAQGAGPIQRIRQSITVNLRAGHLTPPLREQGRLARLEEKSRLKLNDVRTHSRLPAMPCPTSDADDTFPHNNVTTIIWCPRKLKA